MKDVFFTLHVSGFLFLNLYWEFPQVSWPLELSCSDLVEVNWQKQLGAASWQWWAGHAKLTRLRCPILPWDIGIYCRTNDELCGPVLKDSRMDLAIWHYDIMLGLMQSAFTSHIVCIIISCHPCNHFCFIVAYNEWPILSQWVGKMYPAKLGLKATGFRCQRLILPRKLHILTPLLENSPSLLKAIYYISLLCVNRYVASVIIIWVLYLLLSNYAFSSQIFFFLLGFFYLNICGCVFSYYWPGFYFITDIMRNPPIGLLKIAKPHRC